MIQKTTLSVVMTSALVVREETWTWNQPSSRPGDADSASPSQAQLGALMALALHGLGPQQEELVGRTLGSAWRAALPAPRP